MSDNVKQGDNVQGGGTPLTDKIRKAVFDVLPQHIWYF